MHDRFALKRDPEGVNRDIILEDHDGRPTVVNHARQDCDPIVDANQRLRGHRQVGTRGPLRAKLAARVPDIFWYMIWPLKFKEKYGFKNNANRHARRLWREYVLEQLNDSDFSKFRIDEGRLAMPRVEI